MSKTISKDTPFSELTLRKYERPLNLSDRDLTRKLCLSLGLLQPGDSRDIIVDIFFVILKSEKDLTALEIEKEVIKFRKDSNLPLQGIASSNIRRQLKRLRDLFLIESVQTRYRITERMSLSDLFEEKIEKFYLAGILGRVKEYVAALEQIRNRRR